MKQWLETRQVLDLLASAGADGKRAALATVVRVRGSAYRHEGAKLIVCEDGRIAGNVSGGCLEEDVRAVARRVIRSQRAERRTYCGGADEISAWDLGVGCDGQVEIIVEPVVSDRAEERRLIEAELPFVVITALAVTADCIANSEGEFSRRVLTGEDASAWLANGSSRLVESDCNRNGGGDLDSDGDDDGDAESEDAGAAIFVDVMTPPPRLLIVSAGDDATHLARLADEVGFRVIVADRRPGLLAQHRFPATVRLVETNAARLAERIVLDESSFAVVMTHHFADDTSYLRALLKSPARYLGVLGPRQRTERMLGILGGEGSLPPQEDRIHGPVGLDIGTDGAEQVAVSVLAEVLAVQSGRSARSLRDRTMPIHATGSAPDAE